jgi:hypothetical protein
VNRVGDVNLFQLLSRVIASTGDCTMTPETAQVTASILGSIATMIAAGFAIYGIDTWRREHFGRKRADLCEETLALFYEARDAIIAIRNPLSWTSEGGSRKPDPSETPKQTQILNRSYITWERFENRKDVFNRLLAMRYRFMANFGREASEPFMQLNQRVQDVLHAAKQLGTLRTDTRPDALEKWISEFESVVWSGHSDNDQVAKDIDIAIELIEKTCRRVIEQAENGDFIPN